MDTTSSIAGFASYPSALDEGYCDPSFGRAQRVDPENSFTQPVASRPIDPDSGDSDSCGDDDCAAGAIEQRADRGASRFDDGDFGATRAL